MIDRFLDRACAVIGAIFLIQFPVFMQQYFQRFAGHFRELQMHVNLMEKAAHEAGKDLPTWIAKSITSGDPDFVKQGEILQGMVSRFDQFSVAMSAWDKASVWERPFVFLRYVDREIAQATYDSFQFGFSLTLEGGVYALIGLVLGFSIYIAITRTLKAIAKFIFQKEERVGVTKVPKNHANTTVAAPLPKNS